MGMKLITASLSSARQRLSSKHAVISVQLLGAARGADPVWSIPIKRDKIGASTSIRRSSFPRQRRCFKSNCYRRARKDRRPGDSISQALSLERSGCDSSMDWSVFFLPLGGLSDCPTDPAGRDVRSGVSRTRLAFVRERPSTSGMQSLGGSPAVHGNEG